MLITSHASCAPIVEICLDGTVRFNCMEYTKNQFTSIRHINETGKNSQTVLETLQEGLLKEGAKDRTRFHVKVLTAAPVHIEFVVDERHPGGTQIKTVFPVYAPQDELRDYAKVDDDNPEEIHGPLKSYEVMRLLGLGPRHILFHHNATKACLAWMAKDRRVFERYTDFAMSWRREELSAEQLRAIAAYPGRW